MYGLVFKYGFALAAVASRWIAALLYETSAADATASGAMPGALVLAVALAGLRPARRSARADPVNVLRAE